MKPLHILICGDVGTGKSTLIEKLLFHNKRPVYGFITRKLAEDQNGISQVYIHAANAKTLRCTAENRIGTCSSLGGHGNPEVFDTVGVRLLKAPPGGVLLMDELGFMENEAYAFRAAVLHSLDGDIPVLAAVKDRDTPFLQAVRTHRNAKLYWITRGNRNALYEEILPTITAWNS